MIENFESKAENELRGLRSEHQAEIEKLRADFEAKLESTTNAFSEKLNNSQIDVNSLKGMNGEKIETRI